MHFLYPSFLWALGLLAIPIVIHLFHFRRFKKVYFSNVALLDEIKEEVSARSRLKNLLVLLARLLALALLVLAFAQPVLTKDEQIATGVAHLGIIIDNSFSMTAESDDVLLLERAKNRARQIIDAAPDNQKFTLLTNDMEARHQFFLDKDQISQYIDDITVSPVPLDWSVLSRKMTRTLLASGSDNLSAFAMTDWGVDEQQLELAPLDSMVQWYLVPMQAVQESNVSIDTAWLISPIQAKGEDVEILVRMTNRGEQDRENIRLRVEYLGQAKPVSTFDLRAGVSITDTVSFRTAEAGIYDVLLQITDYPVQFDDRFHLSFSVPDQLSVLVLHDGQIDKYVKAAIESSSILSPSFQSVTNISYSSLGDHALIIMQGLDAISTGLSSELKSYVGNGGHVLFIPSASGNLEQYNRFLADYGGAKWEPFRANELEVSRVNTQEAIFSNVFLRTGRNINLPRVQAYFGESRKNRGQRTVMSYRDGGTYLSRTPYQEGNLFALTSPIDKKYSDLVANAEIFVPMIYRMAVSSGAEQPSSYTVAQSAAISVPPSTSKDPVYKLRGQGTEIIPRSTRAGGRLRLIVDEGLQKDGFYRVLQSDKEIGGLAYNYDRSESAMTRISADQLASLAPQADVILEQEYRADFGQVIADRTTGKVLWKWCIIFALIFLLLESILLRIWKK